MLPKEILGWGEKRRRIKETVKKKAIGAVKFFGNPVGRACRDLDYKGLDKLDQRDCLLNIFRSFLKRRHHFFRRLLKNRTDQFPEQQRIKFEVDEKFYFALAIF